MGILGLTTFINEKFTGWRPTNFKKWDHLVIDGNNVCYTLYKRNHPWELGGEYDKFGAKVEEFFTTSAFKHPIVVFDGAHYDPDKMDTIRQRRIDYMTEMREVQAGSEWDTQFGSSQDESDQENDGSTSSDKILPLLILATFIDVLKQMNIEYYIADGEADREIAALANHHKCPVLGSDSDFFIFDLKYGLIYFDRYYCEKEVESLYLLRDLQNQFLFKEKELCLIIPAFFGNGFLKVEKKHLNYDLFLNKLSRYKTCEEYLESSENRISHKDYEDIKKFYWDLQLPDYYEAKKNPKSIYIPAELPEWVYASFKTGKFPIQLIDVCKHRACILPRVVETIKYESAWKISKYIRQRLYHIMGISSDVKEVVRLQKSARLTDHLVPTVSLKPCVSIEEELFSTRDLAILPDLVLTILKCHKLTQEDIETDFNTLNDDWKLPIAATIYWYRSLDDPPSQRVFVICLLITFLTCSEVLPRKDFPFLPVTYYTKPDHLKALHVFAQWQCVYYDAMSLNYLAREPFLSTSPARLYSGNMAMYYAFGSTQKERWLDSVFPGKVSTEWKLLNKFLYLVTGCDEEGRVGKHTIEPRGVDSDSSWTAVQ